MFDFLFKLAFKVLEQVLSEITKQINKVQNEVLNEMTKYVTQGFDDIWRGEDADQFKEKVLKAAVPETESIVSIVSRTMTGLNSAADVMKGADTKVSQLVSDLNSTFSKIF